MWTEIFLGRNSRSRTALESFPSRTLEYGDSEGLPKGQKNYSSFNFWPENLENFRSTELNDVALEGSTIFLHRSSLGHTAFESSRIADLEYAIFRRTGRKTEKLPRWKLFLSTVFKHGLLKGLTILLQYNAITTTPLESSRLGKLKYAISPGYDVRLKNESLREGKKWHFTPGVHCHCSIGCRRDGRYYFDTATQAVHGWIALD